MESPPIVPRNPEVEIKSSKILLLPRIFDIQNNKNLVLNLRKSFSNIHLILGLIKEVSTDYSTDTTLMIKPEGIDEVHIFECKPSMSMINSLSIDYVAITDPQDYVDYEKVIIVNKEVTLQESENEVVKDSEQGIPTKANKIKWDPRPRFSTISANCKRKLKNIKSAVWEHSFSLTVFENALSRSRKHLQDTFVNWGEKSEKILRNWMNNCKSSTSVLLKHLKEVWEGA